MQISIHKLAGKEIDLFIELIQLFERVFEMKDFVLPERQHLVSLLSQPSFYAFVALSGDKVVGGVTAYSMTQYYSARDAVYLFDLAVDQSMQRHGIGKKLVAALNDYCRNSGAEVVFLEADEPDTHAIEFYRSTGAVVEKGYFFSYPLNS